MEHGPRWRLLLKSGQESDFANGAGLQQIEELFVSGLLQLHDGPIDRIEPSFARPTQQTRRNPVDFRNAEQT